MSKENLLSYLDNKIRDIENLKYDFEKPNVTQTKLETLKEIRDFVRFNFDNLSNSAANLSCQNYLEAKEVGEWND